MSALPVIAIFDVGKTNKKLFLFDRNYRMVFEKTARFTETVDEDGDPCENLESLRLSVFDSLRDVFKRKEFDIKSINFSTYGASLVYIDKDGRPLTPLYNYLKEYPKELKQQFYDTYGSEDVIAAETASPVLGNLNSGMQLYRIKYEKPKIYKQMKYALHLPQYMSYLMSGMVCSDMTSIGCHTQLWNYGKKNYHSWVRAEGLHKKLAPISPSDKVVDAAFPGSSYTIGIGLHDSSAALIPYLVNFQEPFVLISTGTWCISLNPFNNKPLTTEELHADCLSYMTYRGKPVKASRLFAGHEHETQVKRIADHFNQSVIRYRSVKYSPETIARLRKNPKPLVSTERSGLQTSNFGYRDLSAFSSDTEAYHQLILDLVDLQKTATQRVLEGTKVRRIFVDGGFSKNAIYMNLLAAAFPQMEVFAASMAQATAIGTALAIHSAWNDQPVPSDIIELKYYSINQGASV